MSATSAEIFLPDAQLSLYREVLQQYLMTNTSKKNFRRRAAAYWNSYYWVYRQATLQGCRSIQHRWSASLISFLYHVGQQSKAVYLG
jgi:hypothetical protein